MLAENLSKDTVFLGRSLWQQQKNSERPCGFAVTQVRTISIPCSKWKLRVPAAEELSHLCVCVAGFTHFCGDASLPGALTKYTVYPASLWMR